MAGRLKKLPSKVNTFEGKIFQLAVAHSLRSHTYSPQSVFRHAHVAPKNRFNIFSPQAAKLCETRFVYFCYKGIQLPLPVARSLPVAASFSSARWRIRLRPALTI